MFPSNAVSTKSKDGIDTSKGATKAVVVSVGITETDGLGGDESFRKTVSDREDPLDVDVDDVEQGVTLGTNTLIHNHDIEPLVLARNHGGNNDEVTPGAFRSGARNPNQPVNREHLVHPNPNGSLPPNSDNEDDGLVEARPVPHHEFVLEEASPVDPAIAEEQRRNGKTNIGTNSLTKTLLLVLVAAVIIVGFVVVAVGFRSHQDTAATTDTTTASNDETHVSEPKDTENNATDVSASDHMLSLLPEQTQETILRAIIFEDYDVPQYQAFQWMIGDPKMQATGNNVTSGSGGNSSINNTGNYSYHYYYSEARMVQRYALAVLFFATYGHSWTFNDGWLSYDVHECDWHCNCGFEKHNPTSSILPFSPCDVNATVTNDTEAYVKLALHANNLAGTLPDEIFLLTSVRSMSFLGSEKMHGTLPAPEYMKRMSNLQFLQLKGLDNVGGSIPAEGLLSLPSLKWLQLCCNKFSGTVPTEIGLFGDRLLHLTLDTNHLSGTVPTEIGLLSNVTDLRVGLNANMSGTLPTQIGMCNKLEKLLLTNMPITGPIPSEMGLLAALKALGMTRTRLTGTLPTELGQWKSIRTMALSESLGITGPIPTEIGLLSTLTHIRWEKHTLTGTIPTELGNLDIFYFSLYDNYLTGPIPSEIGAMGIQQIRNIKLKKNQLTGLIPSEIGLFNTTLKFLELQDNLLSGEIPLELEWLESNFTEIFNVSNNQIHGKVPAALCGIDKIAFDCSQHLCGCDCECLAT